MTLRTILPVQQIAAITSPGCGNRANRALRKDQSGLEESPASDSGRSTAGPHPMILIVRAPRGKLVRHRGTEEKMACGSRRSCCRRRKRC